MRNFIMEFRVQTGSIAALRALRSDLEKTLVEVCRNHHEVVEAAPARLRNEEQDFRLVHYFTFTPWLVYYEYHTLKGELEGERKNFENLIAFFEGIGKGESEIAGVKQQFAKNWVDGPTRHQFNECRRAFYAARQTIMLEAKTAFGSSDLVISLHNATGFADAMDYESGIDPYAGTLIDAPLRSGVLIALEEIEHWLRGGVGNDTAVPKSELIPPRKAYTKIDQSSTGSSTNIQKNSLDLPDDEQNKNELIDSRLTMEKALKLAKNKSYMKKFAKDSYNPITAQEILEVFPKAYEAAEFEGTWGTQAIKNQLALALSYETVNRYLATFYKAGWRYIDDIKIPYKPRSRSSKTSS